MKGQAFFHRFTFAWAGWVAAWHKEKSLRVHAMATCAVLASLAVLRSPPLWWAIMSLTIGCVIATELLNTAIEALADHLHPQRHPAIKVTKDVAAGAVLMACAAALAVGVAFFFDQVLPRLHR